VHPFGDLSAYMDGALSPEARASVQAHLDTCALCRTRLAELRGTARLIAALPMPVPSRSLVPRVSIPVWLAPLRTLSTFASGAALFLFLASAVVSSFPRTQSAGTAPAAAPAPSSLDAARGGAATSATALPSASPNPSLSDQEKRLSPTPDFASPSGAFNAYAPTATPAPSPAERSQTQTAGDDARRSVASAGPSSDLALSERMVNARDQASFNPFPWLWLVLGLAFAALSIILGRRLRSA
jgi:anti-sigma factor RsiW